METFTLKEHLEQPATDTQSTTDNNNDYIDQNKITLQYSGEVNDKKEPHGYGTIIHYTLFGNTTYKFCGEFNDGIKDGQGIEIKYNDNNKPVIRYRGLWKDGCKKYVIIEKFKCSSFFGTGTNTNEDYEPYLVYTGELNSEGKYHGKGKLFFHNNVIMYIGHFVDGKKEGQGTEYYCSNMIKYNGTFVNDLYSGKKCSLYDVEGRLIYRGDFKNGKRHGQGEEFAPQRTTNWKTKYTGDWQNDMYHGVGKLRLDNKYWWTYEGSFRNGKYHGHGKMEQEIVNNGEGNYKVKIYKFEGEFVDGKKQGFGKRVSVMSDNKHDYEGMWDNDCMNGKGKLIWTYNKKSDVMYEGDFLNDIFHGKGKYVNHIGDIYEGDFANNKYNGFGVMKYKSNGTIYEGEWKDNVKHGSGIVYNANGDIQTEGEWENGKMKKNKTKKRHTASQMMNPRQKQMKLENAEKQEDENTITIPDEYKCPISLNIMKDPVICSDGHTYDKKSISQLFSSKNNTTSIKSPKTRESLDKNIMIPNYNLRKIIEEYLASIDA